MGRHPEARRIQIDRDWRQYRRGDVVDISDHNEFCRIINGQQPDQGERIGHVVDDSTPLTGPTGATPQPSAKKAMP